MKKVLAIALLFILSACATSGSYSVMNCAVSDCQITAVHHHAFY